MAKGSIAKAEIFKKMLSTFEGSFMPDDKTLRIPYVENGETIEIKVALTAAKDILGSAAPAVLDFSNPAPKEKKIDVAASAPTKEEKENVAKLVKALNLDF